MSGSNPPALPKGYSEASYAVNRPSDAGPSSPHSPQGDDDNDRPNTPPPYSGPTTSSMTQPQPVQSQLHYPGLPRLEYRLYTPATFTLSSDATTITSYEPRYSTYPAALVSLVQSLATVPPKPQIRIVGRSPGGEPDFDVKLNLMNLIVTDDVKRRMNYVKIIGQGDMGFRGETSETTSPSVNGGLEEWARLFCEDNGSIKHFALERTVTNWDTSYLEGRLLSLVHSTSYGGHVTVMFPLTHCRVIIRNPDKVNRFFSNVTKVFTGTRKYEVIKSVWPYADVSRGEPGRKCTVQEEEAWLRNWSDSIRHAILSRRKGWVTAEDRLEFLMEPKESEKAKPAPWGGTRAG